MTRHPDTGVLALVRLGDGPDFQTRDVRAHIAECVTCFDESNWIGDTTDQLRAFTRLDATPDDWAVISARVRNGDATILPTEETTPRRRLFLRVAAIALLTFTGAAAIPGSPFRTWVYERMAASSDLIPPPVAPPLVPESDEFAALIIEPLGNLVDVVVERPQDDLELRVRIWEGSAVEIEARGAAARTQFRAAPGRLIVTEPLSGSITVKIPQRLDRLRITVDNVEYLLKTGNTFRLSAPLVDTIGSEFVLPITPRQ